MKSMNTPGTLTIKSQQDDSGQRLIWSWMLALEFLQRSWTNSSIHFSLLNPNVLVWGWRSASRSYNRMTGRLWADPNPESGSIFRFTLPIERTAHQAA